MGTVQIGSTTYNIMGSLSGARDYLKAHPSGSTFIDAEQETQIIYLVTATRWLARLEEGPPVRWTGEKTVSSQTTAFPRDGATCNGEAVADGTTPQAMIDGEYELALALLLNPSIQNSLTEGGFVKRAKGGSAEVEFFGPTRGGLDDTPLPAAVWQLVGCYTTTGTETGMAAYGTDGTSSFGTLGGSLSPYGYA